LYAITIIASYVVSKDPEIAKPSQANPAFFILGSCAYAILRNIVIAYGNISAGVYVYSKEAIIGYSIPNYLAV
jgi:hypothetical protein